MTFMGRVGLRALGSAVVLFVVGCDSPASNGFPEVAVRDSAGIRIVEHAAIPTTLPSWSISSEPILAVGSADGPGPDVFGRIQSLAVLSNGTIVVADGLSNELRVFDRRGDHIWSAGGTGGGPGEFTSLDGAYVISGDSIVVADGGQILSVFAPDGRHASQIRLDPPPEDYPVGPMISGVTSGGAVVGSALGIPQFEPGYYRTSALLVFYDRNGRSTGALGPLLHGEGVMTVGDGGAYTSRLLPMGRGTQIAAASDVFAVTTQERFEIKTLDSEGRIQTIIRVAADPLAVDPDVRRRYLEHAPEASDTDAAGRAGEGAIFGELLPALGRIVYDSDGYLWVQEYLPPYDDRAPNWWVLDQHANFVAQASPPADLDVQEVGTGSIVGTSFDELGVPEVRVYELTR